MFNKCQSSPLLPGVTASPKESPTGVTGTPTPELLEFAHPGWEPHHFSLPPSKFLGEIIARYEMGRESVVITIHPTSKLGTQLAQQPSYSAWRGPCPPHFPGPKHPPLFGSGRGGGQRAAFEQSLQFKRKNT